MNADTTTVTTHRVRKRRRRHHRRRARRRLLLLFFLLVLIAIGYALWTALPAARAAQDARGQLHALQAEKATLHHVPTGAELTTLEGHVHQLAGDMRTINSAWGVWGGPALFVSQVAPSLHAQLQQIDTLVPLGVQVTQASDRLLQTLTPIVAQAGGSLDSSSATTLVTHLAGVRSTLQALAGQFGAADTLRQRIDAAEVPSALRSGVQLIDDYLPAAPSALRALAALPDALGVNGPRTYLLVPQNPEDLRASGGYIGTVVLLRADKGQIHLVQAMDAGLVEPIHMRPNVIPPLPLALHVWGAWFFRDANWSANFPTSAQLLALFYNLDTHRHVDGVIAITPSLLRTLFALTGPVRVPGYPTPLTANNAFSVIDQQVNTPQQVNKSFAVAAYEAVFDRLIAGPHTVTSAVLSSLRQNVRARDLQIFSYDQNVERAVEGVHADGGINPTTGDYLYVTDTNISQNKVNQLIQERISYTATVQQDHTLQATTTIRYVNDADDQNVPVRSGTEYQDFVRVFVPEGSTLIAATGFDQPWPTFTVHHKTQFSGYFALASHQTHTVTLRYRIPATADPADTYSLYVQRQAGTAAIPFDATVSGIWLASGTATLHTALTRDVTLTAPLLGGQGLPPAAAPPPEPLLTPGSHPEPWVSVPTGLVPYGASPIQLGT